MSSTDYTSFLPQLYSRWLGALLERAIPNETLATCGDCAMCVKEKGQLTVYHPDVKCCSYIPILPNFLVGRVLADADPDAARGRETLVQRIDKGMGLTPLGISASPDEDLRYRHILQHNGFGRPTGIRCPHYLPENGGGCGIYKSRNAVCATYHCKFVRGAVGQSFWSVTLAFLGKIETGLSRWAVLQLIDDPDALALVFHPDAAAKSDPIESGRLSGIMGPAHAKRAWSQWDGRVHDFFIECAKLVEPLELDRVLEICGPDAQAYARLEVNAFGKLLSEVVPSALKMGPFQVAGIDGEDVAITTYSQLDPISLPRPFLNVLHYFDGRPTLRVVQELYDKEDIEVDDGFLSKLVDYKVLVEAE